MTYASLEEVVLYRPFHQIAVDCRLCDLLVVLNRFVVVSLEGCEIRDFEEELIRQSAHIKSALCTAILAPAVGM